MNTFLKGEVVYLYAFDVAEEIRTEKISKILAKKAMPFEVQPDKTLPKYFPFYKPLTIDPHRDSWKHNGLNVKTVVRVYDVGVVSIIVSIPFEVSRLEDLIRFHAPMLDNQRPVDRVAHELCVDVVKNLKDYIIRGMPEVLSPEAYTVFNLRSIPDGQNVEQWVREKKQEITGLLAETDPGQLSNQQIDETFRYCISFSQKDVTIVDWDAALVIDLAGPATDILHVLELANLQLEEMVLMDQRLDRFLDRAYEDLEKRPSWFGGASKGLEKLRRFRMDVAKITDEVSNISKFFGDWYLARIYLAARDRFHLSTWRESIQSRLTNLDHLYEVFHSEANEIKMLVLEALIVLLFVIDLFVVFFKG